MPRLVPILAALAVTLATLASPPPAFAHGDRAHAVKLVHGRWFDGGRFVARDVFVSGGVLHERWDGEVEDTLDLAGRFVIPPLADAHTHGLSDTARFAAVEHALLRAGIFGVRNPNLPGSATPWLRERLAARGRIEAVFANGGLTAPGGHPVPIYEGAGHGAAATLPAVRRWAGDAYVEVADEAALERAWPRVLAGKPDFVKVYLESSEHHAARRDDPAMVGRRGLDPALVPAVVTRARAAGLAVSVHATTAADVRTAVRAGVDELAHLPLEALTDEDARAIAARGVTVVTTLVSHRAPESAALDSVHAGNLRRLRAAGVKLALGTDSPAHDVVDEAVAMRRLGVVTGAALVRLATTDTWRAVFPSRPARTLAPGQEASFLVLDGDPAADVANLRRVHLRVWRGEVVRPEPPATKPSVAEAMAPLLMRGDLAGAFAAYDSLKRAAPGAYDFSEQALNQLGYAMLRHGQARGAIAIFERNAAEFPRSANAWDSMADGWLAAGDTTKAIAAYREVLARLPLNPHYAAGYAAGLEKRAREWIDRPRR